MVKKIWGKRPIVAEEVKLELTNEEQADVVVNILTDKPEFIRKLEDVYADKDDRGQKREKDLGYVVTNDKNKSNISEKVWAEEASK